MSEACRSIEVKSLRPGQRLDEDIVDSRGLLLLRAGQPVTNAMLEQLRKRGIDSVETRGEEASRRKATVKSRGAEPVSLAAPPRVLNASLDAFDAAAVEWPDESLRRNQRLELGRLREAVEQGLGVRDDMARQYERLAQNVAQGGTGQAGVMQKLVGHNRRCEPRPAGDAAA